MKNYMEEYYYMVPTGYDYPLIDFVNSMTDSFLLYKKHALDETHLMKFVFGDPLPDAPKLADAHSCARHLVISNKIKDAMQGMGLKDVQFLPATISDPVNNKEHDGYWALHIHNLIECLDKEKSDCWLDDDDGSVIDLDELVLDNEKLDTVPLDDRLVFALGEKRLYMFFHASVVEKLKALSLEGVEFSPLG